MHFNCWYVKRMAPHSSTLAWKIPWTEEPGRLQSMGSLGVEHNWATSLSILIFMHQRRKWHPTPVFLPGESQGWRSLVGCCLWGRTESDTTEATCSSSSSRMWRGTKEPLNEGEIGEWKSWLKIQHSKNEDHGIWSYHFMANRWGKSGNSVRFPFLGLLNHCRR